MSRASGGRSRRKDRDADEDEEEEKPRRSAAAASSSAAASRRKGKAAAGSDDDAPAFDMADIEAELRAADAEAAGDDSPPPVERKRRFPKRELTVDSAASSRANSRANSRAGSRKGSAESAAAASSQKLVRMEDLDRWKWASKYTEEGDQTTERLQANLLAWERVPLPANDLVDVAGTMQLRKFLWKNKKIVRQGVPPAHRLLVWSVVSGARTMPDRLEHLNRYAYYLSQAHTLSSKTQKEIAADIPRALNAHPKFSSKTTKEGAEELRRVLSAFAVRSSPNIGYVNSLSHIAAYFLLFYNDEEAFWILCALVDIVLPPDYFTQSLLGLRADAMLLKLLVYQRMPKLHAHFAALGLDVYSVGIKWLMTLYFLCLSKECVARMLDVLFVEGSNILVSMGLAFFHHHTPDLLERDDLMELLSFIGSMGAASGLTDNEYLMRLALRESTCKLGEEDDKRRQIERAVMANAYMKDLQQTQLHRKAEDEKRKADLEATAKREREEEESLALGVEMFKIGQYGDAKLTTVTMERHGSADWIVRWTSKRKKGDEASLLISHCTLHFGLRHGNFASRPEFQKRFTTAKKHAFTLFDADKKRSLDLVAQTSHDMQSWKALFYRAGFPLRNAAAVLRLRRRIEKKKTLKRMQLAARGKFNVRIESSDDDYDLSDEGTDTPEEGAAPAAASSASASASASAAAASSAKSNGASRRRTPVKAEEEEDDEEEERRERNKSRRGRRRDDDDD